MSLSEEWEKILESEGLGNIESGELLKKEVDLVKYNIDEIVLDIQLDSLDGVLNFIFEGNIIGVIDYKIINNEEVYINIIANLNSSEENYYNYDLKNTSNLISENKKIKGLIFFMYKSFFSFLKQKGFKKVLGKIDNEILYKVNDKLLQNGFIKKLFTQNIDGEIQLVRVIK